MNREKEIKKKRKKQREREKENEVKKKGKTMKQKEEATKECILVNHKWIFYLLIKTCLNNCNIWYYHLLSYFLFCLYLNEYYLERFLLYESIFIIEENKKIKYIYPEFF